MKVSTFLFILAGLMIFSGGNGKYDVFAAAIVIVGLSVIGAFLLINHY